MPLVRVFSNPGFKDRHWEDISTLVGFQIKPDRDVMLYKLIDLEVTNHLAKLEEISENASKEYNIEKILNRMLDDWEPI